MKHFLLFALALLLGAATLLLGPVIPLCIAVAVAIFFLLVHWPRPVAAIALTFVVFGPGYAVAASIEIGQALTGGLQDIINAVVTGAIAALVGWVAIVVKNKFGIDIEAQHRQALTAFLQRQASGLVAMGAVKLNGVKIEVQNEAVAAAANTALKAIPDALKFFGLTPEKLQGMIVDLLPKEPAVAQAAAVALDAANPATSSK